MALRILLPAIGSSGDVHPVIGLGRALRARGHEAIVVTNAKFASQVRANGLGFIELGTAEAADDLMRDPRLWHLRKGFRCIAEKAIVPMIRPLYEIIAAHRGGSTVVAATSLCLGARVAQDHLGIPTATLHLQPGVFRSLVDNGRLWRFDLGPQKPRALKRLFFWIADRLIADRLICPGLNAVRSSLGLAPARGVFRSYLHSPRLVLGLFPAWFARPQPDWPPNSHLTGFVLHDEGERPLPDAAEAFLASGPPPVLVTPGSAATDRTAFFERTARACAESGRRAMLVTNFPEQLPAALPPGVQAFPYLPFSRVLPRCAAIVYHGGIGTLAQAVRAGTPHLVVPNAHDQPDNGQRIERLGLGLCLSPRRYTVGRARLAFAELGSPAVLARCAAFAPRVDAGRALDEACGLIESLGSPAAV
jgi:rhamnosyltransferase subunit B